MVAKAKFDYEITEMRSGIFLICVIGWFFALLGYWVYVFNLPKPELSAYFELVSSMVPEGLGIMVLIWPFYAMFLGIGTTYISLRVIYRLVYGRWV